MTAPHRKRIVIVGAGFGGIRLALKLARRRLPYTRIILINDKPHFEYHAALYRVVTGHSPLETCVPLRDIFAHSPVEILEDRIVGVDLQKKELRGNSGSRYEYETLVLALGSETEYFNIPGLKEHSYGFKTVTEALALKRHLHEMMVTVSKVGTMDEKVKAAHFLVVGGGASGTEIAGDLAHYAKKIATTHKLDSSIVTIDIIEAAPRLVPMLLPKFSSRVESRLRELGVNIFLNRTVVKEEIETVHLKDMQLQTQTLIWTAGIRAHRLLGTIKDLETDKKGRAIVDEYLRAKGQEDVFVIGDGAATMYSGMAQTALYDADFVAERITEATLGNRVWRLKYIPRKPWYVIPTGHHWAGAQIGNLLFFGHIGWFLRRLADFRAFQMLMPAGKALATFMSTSKFSETCPLCETEKNH